MFIINIYKKIGIVFIVFSLASLSGLRLYQYLDYKKHSIIIDNIFKEGQVNEFDYIGYIEIPSLNIKREIIYGINDKNLNKNIVTTNKKIILADDDNIILAGHSIENVFGKLHYINVGDEIKITSFYETIFYVVKDIKEVNKEDVNELNGNLCLITCMNDSNKRLIVYAEKKDFGK